MIQTKLFSDYDKLPIDKLNQFIKKVKVIDIKMTTVFHSPSNNFYSQYLVIYEEVKEDE